MMPVKHFDLEIDIKNPFANCKLGREKYAQILTSVIENYQEGFVLGLNNKWGTGKTTFVKMWEQYLKNQEYTTIYFNAWENDFEDSPLTALVSELKFIKGDGNIDKFDRVVEKAAQISKNVAPALLKAILSKYIDSKTLVEALSNASEGILENFKKDVEEYSKRKESINQFRESLKDFVAANSNDKPLIFIIDELDRCRPNYSVLLLEQIKHLFSVPNIVFILSIDKIQLGHAIRGVYGSDKIDSDEYLRRFIDIEYSLPDNDNEKFIDYLYKYYNFDSFFNLPQRKSIWEFESDKKYFIYTSKFILKNLKLRELEKILSHTRIVLRTLQNNNYLMPSVFLFLIYVKNKHLDFYDLISSHNTSISVVQSEFYRIIESFRNEDTEMDLIKIEAELLLFFKNFKVDKIDKAFFNENELSFESKINNEIFQKYIDGRLSYNKNLKLSYLIEKINLTDSILIN